MIINFYNYVKLVGRDLTFRWNGSSANITTGLITISVVPFPIWIYMNTIFFWVVPT